MFFFNYTTDKPQHKYDNKQKLFYVEEVEKKRQKLVKQKINAPS